MNRCRGRTHNSREVQDFVAANRDKIRLFFLPPHSHELNPDEPRSIWAKDAMM